ncbi:MAG: hypothetical protein IJ026_01595 [Candidatus Methanomethylophilaceae archaeon]|nr:hypothetical protein [Candidatus Methanomethylophilaceae archaeon]
MGDPAKPSSSSAIMTAVSLSASDRSSVTTGSSAAGTAISSKDPQTAIATLDRVRSIIPSSPPRTAIRPRPRIP